MKSFKKIISCMGILFLLLASSCNVSPKKQEPEDKIKDGVYPLASPVDVFETIENLKIPYDYKVLNPEDNVQRYYTDKNKSLNLGVYLTDLAYAATFESKTELNIYLKYVNEISGPLDLKINYNELASIKIDRKKLTTKITSDISETYATLYLKDIELSALFLVGIWVEELYIASNISNELSVDDDLVKLIIKEREMLDILLTVIDKVEDKSSITESFIGALGKLQSVYAEISDRNITEENIVQIKSTIASIRESIIY